MSDIKSITQIGSNSGDLIRINQLEDLLAKQQVFVHSLLDEKKSLEAKIKHLEQLMMSNSRDLLVSISPEEMTCTEQLSILKANSMVRELTIEEAKKLEIYVKTLQTIRKESTLTIKRDNLSGYSDEELLAIAKNE